MAAFFFISSEVKLSQLLLRSPTLSVSVFLLQFRHDSTKYPTNFKEKCDGLVRVIIPVDQDL